MDTSTIRTIRHMDLKIGMRVVPYEWVTYGDSIPQGTVLEILPCDCPDSATAGPMLRIQWDAAWDQVPVDMYPDHVAIRHAGNCRRVVTRPVG